MPRVLLLVTLFSLPLAASAQSTPWWELYGGYQYTRTDISGGTNMNGFNVSLQENSARWWGGIIDVSGSFQNVSSSTQNQSVSGNTKPNFYTFAAGPQFTYRKNERLQPFGRIMFGGAHTNLQLSTSSTVTTTTGFALIGGGGVDYVLKDFVAFRVTGDYVRSYLFSDTQNNIRVSVGVDFRIGQK